MVTVEQQKGEHFLRDLYKQIGTVVTEKGLILVHSFSSQYIEEWDKIEKRVNSSVTVGLALEEAAIYLDREIVLAVAIGKGLRHPYAHQEVLRVQFGGASPEAFLYEEKKNGTMKN